MSEFNFRIKERIPNRVLIADDDPVIRHLLAAVIRQQQCEAIIATDGREAYRVLQSDSKFRAAILDISMPFLDGPESCAIHAVGKTSDEDSNHDRYR